MVRGSPEAIRAPRWLLPVALVPFPTLEVQFRQSYVKQIRITEPTPAVFLSFVRNAAARERIGGCSSARPIENPRLFVDGFPLSFPPGGREPIGCLPMGFPLPRSFRASGSTTELLFEDAFFDGAFATESLEHAVAVR